MSNVAIERERHKEYEIGRTVDFSPEEIAQSVGGRIFYSSKGTPLRIDLPEYDAYIVLKMLEKGSGPVAYSLIVIGRRDLDCPLWHTGIVKRGDSVSFVEAAQEVELWGKSRPVADGMTIAKPGGLTEGIQPFKRSFTGGIVEAAKYAQPVAKMVAA